MNCHKSDVEEYIEIEEELQEVDRLQTSHDQRSIKVRHKVTYILPANSVDHSIVDVIVPKSFSFLSDSCHGAPELDDSPFGMPCVVAVMRYSSASVRLVTQCSS